MVFKRNPREGNESGFTLIEVMLAMVILTVGLLSIAVAQISAMKLSSKSQHLSQATLIAEQQLEEFLAQPGDDPFYDAAVTDLADPNTTDWDINTADNDETRYSVLLTVDPNSPAPGLTRLTVNVSWDTANGTTHDISLQGVKRVD